MKAAKSLSFYITYAFSPSIFQKLHDLVPCDFEILIPFQWSGAVQINIQIATIQLSILLTISAFDVFMFLPTSDQR